MTTETLIKGKTMEEIIGEVNNAVSNVFGSTAALDDEQSKVILTTFLELFTEKGLQINQYEEILEGIKKKIPLIHGNSIENLIKVATEKWRQSKNTSMWRKLNDFRTKTPDELLEIIELENVKKR